MYDKKTMDLLEEFQTVIEYKFNDISLLKQSLTTKNRGYQNREPDFKGLDTLGDKLLDFLLVLKTFDKGDRSPHFLNSARDAARNKILSDIALDVFHLEKYIFKFGDEDIVGTVTPASILEALIAAVFLDCGRDYKIVEGKIITRIDDWISNLKFTAFSDLK